MYLYRQKPCKTPAKQSILPREIVNLAAPLWLFCSLTLTISPFQTFKMTLRRAKNDTPNHVFRPWKHDFSWISHRARKYQSPAIIAIIYSLHFNTIQLQPFPPTTNFSNTDISSRSRYHHDFCLWHAAFTVILALSFRLKRIFCHLCIKNFAKIICNTENFSNFVLGNHSEIL